MTTNDIIKLKALVDGGRTAKLTSSTRLCMYDLMDSIDEFLTGINNQIAKTYGGKVDSKGINFEEIKKADQISGIDTFSEIVKKVEEDINHELTEDILNKFKFNFMSLEDFEAFISPYTQSHLINNTDGSQQMRDITIRYNVGEERILRKYLLLK